METTITIEIKNDNENYPVFIYNSILADLHEFVQKNYSDKKIVIITDENVKKIFGAQIQKNLDSLNPKIISIPYGESSKSRKMKADIEDQLLDGKYGRDTLILAIGGGVVGDLAGFVASTYKRGIPVIQVPTTFLSMVDSSVGGKTAINTPYGKNLIGTFWQPEAVFVGLDFLETLSEEELLNGFAESLKIAIIRDKLLFSYIEENSQKVIAKDKDVLFKIIKRSIELKRDVVQQDTKESGMRQILNFGHTVGHAFETLSHYKIKHGFCVSLGIVAEAKLAVIDHSLSKEEFDRILRLQSALKLPIKAVKQYKSDQIIEVMKSDKKALKEVPQFLIIESIGEVKNIGNSYSFKFDDKVILSALEILKQC